LLATIERNRVPPDLSPESARRGVISAVRAFIQYFADNPQLAVAQKSGYFRPDFDAAMMAECYNGSLDRLNRRHLLTGKATVDELADLVAELFLRAVRSDPHERR